MSSDANYNSWTKTGLIQRLKELEAELKRRPAPPEESKDKAQQETSSQNAQPESSTAAATAKKPKGKKKMDPSKYATRYIALKLAYLGKNYGGYEFQAMGNQPSIEEELWNALTKACLIFPQDERVVEFDCCEYSKCGRTDRGVSAFGQVIGLRVRSNQPLPRNSNGIEPDNQQDEGATAVEQDGNTEADAKAEKPFDPILDELHYPRMLNRILPPDIRILGWCPSPPPDFSARFSCRERQYRYFFTQPAFVPDPSPSAKGSIKPGWLDIEAMRDAAKRFEGDHDFRNFCKIDAAKQITNFSRRIFEADIVEVKDVNSSLPFLGDQAFVSPGTGPADGILPKVYSFNVRGSAFLWHQIRHMVSVLFLVGQRLESPSVVTELLDVRKNPCKPNYNMADEVPLVLWDCIFPEDLSAEPGPTGHTDSLDWVYVGEDSTASKFGQHGVMDSIWATWRERKIDELLANQLVQKVSQQGGRDRGASSSARPSKQQAVSARVFEGGNTGRMGGKYVHIMNKDKQQSPEEQNDRYAKRKGYASAEDMRAHKGFRSINDVEMRTGE